MVRKKYESYLRVAIGASVLLLGSASVQGENSNTTIQEGRVNINRTIQYGTDNDNATYQTGKININRTIQVSDDRRRTGQLGRVGHRRAGQRPGPLQGSFEHGRYGYSGSDRSRPSQWR